MGGRPDAIDNSDILEGGEWGLAPDDAAVKPNLKEGTDFVVLSEEVEGNTH